MQNFLIIYCHPWNKSFNHAELEAIKSNLSNKNIHFEVIDLYSDGFQPIYDIEEMRLFHAGKTHDPLVQKYLASLKGATDIIFISPVEWNDIPAMLKGFIDKVMKEGPVLTHVVSRTGIKGLLTNIKHAYVFTTSTSPNFYLRLFAGNGIKRVFINHTLKQIGVQKPFWKNYGGISTSTFESRTKYLTNLKSYEFKVN